MPYSPLISLPPAPQGRRTCRHLRRSAFTLIEILVVVAIIALLIAILLPSLAAARAQARTALCGSNQKQMGLAMNMFSTEHGGRVPRGISRHGNPDPTGPVNWVKMVARMFGDKANYAENFNRVPVERMGVFSCPQRAQEYGGTFLDYVVNSTDSRGPMQLNPCTQQPTSGQWYEVEGVTRIHKWRYAGDTVYILEAVEESWEIVDANNSFGTLRGIRENIKNIRQQVPPSQTGYDWFDVPGGLSMPTFRSMAGTGKRLPRASIKMHPYGTSALFVDGHVSLINTSRKLTELKVYQFWMQKLGVEPRIIPQVNTTNTTAAIDPCTAGDTTWRPGR